MIAQQTPKPRLVTGCVGDSRAVLGRKPTSGGLFGMGGKSAWEAVSLSKDQKPDDPGEKARIEAAGGKVKGGGADGGPARVWKRIEGLGILGVATARSIGDLALNDQGVIAEPVVTERPIGP